MGTSSAKKIGDGAATGEGPTIGWTDEGGLVESWIILGCQLD
jgi:hypothetical protein